MTYTDVLLFVFLCYLWVQVVVMILGKEVRDKLTVKLLNWLNIPRTYDYVDQSSNQTHAGKA